MEDAGSVGQGGTALNEETNAPLKASITSDYSDGRASGGDRAINQLY